MKQSKVEVMLRKRGDIDPSGYAYLHEAEKEGKTPAEIISYLAETGILKNPQMLSILGEYYELPTVDILTYPVDLHSVAMIPKRIAEKYNILAIGTEGYHLILAVHDPMNLYAFEDVRLVTNMQIKTILALKEELQHAIDLHYSEVLAQDAADRMKTSSRLEKFLIPDLMLEDDDEELAPTVRLLNSLLIKGYNTNISDIHIEPYEKEATIRMRRDGMLLPYMNVSLTAHQGLAARTKILAKLDIAEKRKPQDGHFGIVLNHKELNLRVSFVPTVFGEKCVIRFLTTNKTIDHASTFGMTPANYQKMQKLLANPYGLIYISGPTGSGKTTTLYEVLRYMSNRPVNIITIEDPVERNIPKINQMQVNEMAGITFQTGMRAMLRQDPDIIMVGETRDSETAVISARAAMTGHLVFSTLHTNDAASAVVRLKDLGLPDYLIENSLVGVVAQRLVRKICPYCKTEYTTTDIEANMFSGAVRPVTLFKGTGCHLCENTGYLGRIAVHEILMIDRTCRAIISEGYSIEKVKSHLQEQGISSLREEIESLVLTGITSVDEMERVTYQMQR